MTEFQDDLPIKHPDEDEFGFGAFSKTISECILRLKEPNGSVIAIHGPWGSGKSSLVNLVVHELEKNADKDPNKDPVVISFSSWCYRHEEGIVNGFFQEFRSRLPQLNLKPDETSDIQNLLISLGFAASAEFAAESGVDPVAVEGIKTMAKSRVDSWRTRRKEKKERERNVPVEILQREIGNKLKKRVLIVIDDIDRLSEEEAKAIFRLIKSVGRIKNVIYLLAYDKEVENAIRMSYYSEKDSYFEKIVQASFDLPEPNKSKLIEILNTRFEDIFENDLMISSRRIYETVHEVVVPELKTLRDVHRFSNILSVSYPSVRYKVDVADFIALEALRIFRPRVYQVIRSKKDVLTRAVGYPSDINRLALHHDIEEVYLSDEKESEHIRLRSVLQRIFPSSLREFESPAFSEVEMWAKEKRARSTFHFDTYFAFSIAEDTISEFEFEEFIQNIHNNDFVKTTLINFMSSDTENGRTKASYLLDKIARNFEYIDINDVESFLTCLFSVVNELKSESDLVREFGYLVGNEDRIIRICKKLLVNRFEIVRVSEIMFKSIRAAPLDFQTEMCKMAHYYHSSSENYRSHKVINMLSVDDTENLKHQIYQNIHDALADRSIFGYKNFIVVLENCREVSHDPENIKHSMNSLLESRENVITYAREFGKILPDISHDDYHSRAMVARIERVIDIGSFINRMHHVIQEGDLTKEDENIINRTIEILSLGIHGVKLS